MIRAPGVERTAEALQQSKKPPENRARPPRRGARPHRPRNPIQPPANDRDYRFL